MPDALSQKLLRFRLSCLCALGAGFLAVEMDYVRASTIRHLFHLRRPFFLSFLFIVWEILIFFWFPPYSLCYVYQALMRTDHFVRGADLGGISSQIDVGLSAYHSVTFLRWSHVPIANTIFFSSLYIYNRLSFFLNVGNRLCVCVYLFLFCL